MCSFRGARLVSLVASFLRGVGYVQSSRTLFLAFRLTVSVGMLVYLITIFDWERVWHVLTQLHIIYVWPAPVLLILHLFVAGVRWSVLLSYFGVWLKLRDAFLLYMIGNYYSIVLPGVIGGDIVRIGLCADRHKKPIADIATTAVIERVAGLLMTLIIGSVAVLVFPGNLWLELGVPVVLTLLLLAIGLLVACVGGVIAMRLMPTAWLYRGRRSFGRLHGLLAILRKIRHIPMTTLCAVVLLSGCAQVLDIISSYFLARAFHIDLPLRLFFVLIPLVYIVTVLPISLGGLGVREGVMVFLLSRVGELPSDAVMYSFLVYLNYLFIALWGGAVQFLWSFPKHTYHMVADEHVNGGAV